jgi:DNA-binding response OmpR family regulator
MSVVDRPEPAVPPGSLTRRPFILAVDDSDDMRSLLRDLLLEAGYEVSVAGTGERALRLMTRRRPDLVITDLLMPGMSGFSLRATMLRRSELASVPVIVLSAYWRKPGETLDAFDVLPKPLNVDRLLESVRRLLRPGESATS